MIECREVGIDRAREVADLHRKYIPWGFLSELDPGFIVKTYEALILLDSGIVFGAFEGERMIGYVSGALSKKDYYMFFIKRNAGMLIPFALKNITKIKKIKETSAYAFSDKDRIDLPGAELFAIVVDEEYQKKGIAQDLLNRISEWFYRKGAPEFKTSVGEDNPKSIRFFEKAGCRESGEVVIHQGERSRIFIGGHKTGE